MYILLTRIPNVPFNPQLVLFDRLPFRVPYGTLNVCLIRKVSPLISIFY